MRYYFSKAEYYLLAVAILSVIAFILYGVDKRKAIQRRRRISENILLGAGLIGGAPGALLGMIIWRHKTRRWYFWATNFLGLSIVAFITVFLCMYNFINRGLFIWWF